MAYMKGILEGIYHVGRGIPAKNKGEKPVYELQVLREKQRKSFFVSIMVAPNVVFMGRVECWKVLGLRPIQEGDLLYGICLSLPFSPTKLNPFYLFFVFFVW